MPQLSPPPAPRSVLTGWQRPLVKLLVLGTILLGGTGLFLLATPGGSPGATGALAIHILAGAVLLPVLFVFTVPHAVVQTRRKPFVALSGGVVLLLALACTASGAYLIVEPQGASRAAAWSIHLATGFGVLLVYVVHRRFGSNPASWLALGGGLAVTAAVGAGLALWERADPGPRSVFDTATAEAAEAARGHFAPSHATTGAGELVVSAKDIQDLARCVDCHQVIVGEWKRSAHRHASMTNPFYRISVEDLRERFPKEDARWCAGCHDPALLFTKDPVSGLPPIAAPHLDMLSDDARTGLTCVSCHAIDPQSTAGNADYVLRGRRVYPGESSDNPAVRAAHDVLLRLKPKAHVDSLRPHNVQESAFCSLCHKAQPPPELTRWRWARAQDEYDAHDDSGVSMGNARSFYHPPASKRCQDCHMPLVADPDDPTADAQGMVRSHLFAAANTGLPFLRDDTEMIQKIQKFLATACRVDVTEVVLPGERRFLPAGTAKPAVRPGDVVEAHVVVRNLGVGHAFPGGTADSNEAWLHFEASVGGQPAFYASGRIDPATNEVDPSAEHYRSYWLRRDGTRFVSRVANDLYTLLYAKRIGPGTADVVRYRFRVPEGATGTLELKATLRYRKFFLPLLQQLAAKYGTGKGLELRWAPEKDFLVRGEERVIDLAKLPVSDMASGSLSLPITADGTQGPAPDPATLPLELPLDRERINDLGIAHLLQGDPVRAREIFSLVTRLDPAYADGWVNVGRAAVALQEWDAASAALAEAERRKPGWAKAAFFRGMVLRNGPGGDFAGAEAEFRHVLTQFPRDRETHRRLADVLYQEGKLAECLAVIDRYMKIEPEDWEAWYWAMRCYEDLGETEKAEQARVAHDKYRPDDDRTNRAGPYVLDDPNLHRLAQPIHVHEQAGLPKATAEK